MKLCIVMPLAEQRGGAELMLWQLLSEAAGDRPDWTVVFLEAGPMVGAIGSLGYPTEVFAAGKLREAGRYVATVIRLASHLRHCRRDAVVSWMPKAHLYSGPAAAAAGKRALWFQHGVVGPRHALDSVATLLPASGVLACSQAAAKSQSALVPHRPTAVVYPAVDLTLFKPFAPGEAKQTRSRLGLPPDAPIIGSVGRLHPQKGMHNIVAAAARVRQTHPNVHCCIVGGPDSGRPQYLDELKTMAANLGVLEHVTFAGLQHNVPEWMSCMDIVVHAADSEGYTEGFGMVNIEAMAAGKPVISIRAGGPAEVIHDGVDGVLVPSGAPECIADAAIMLLNSPADAARIGSAAICRARDFSVERLPASFTAAVDSLLHTLMGRGHPGTAV